jgi:hypothetical protein
MASDRGYGNWTEEGWNLRFRGSVYKQPNLSKRTIDNLANIFLLGSVKKLPSEQYEQAINMTRSIFVLPQKNIQVSFRLSSVLSARPSDGFKWNDIGNPLRGEQAIDIPRSTNFEGDFDEFVPVKNISGSGLLAGNATSRVQRIRVHARGTNTGNATSYLVPSSGLTIISDVDDILRLSKVYQPREGLRNLFARPFMAWMNMPHIFANWSRTLPDVHFHYLTTTPEQLSQSYMKFVYQTYPEGSFDTRLVNVSDLRATFANRRFLLDKIFRTFPGRKFVLLGDTSNLDIMENYPSLVHKFPNQVQCIFIRNTSSMDPKNRIPYNTKGFEELDQEQYMFFRVPVSLYSLTYLSGNLMQEYA